MRILGYAGCYVLCTALLLMLGFVLFLLVSDLSRDVLRIHKTLDRGTYSTIQAILTIMIYGGSFLFAIPTARRLMRFLRTPSCSQ